MQIRLCYTANTFVNVGQYKGKLQEVTQVGAELMNDDSSDADAEMVAITVESLLKSGLKEFQLEVGHADFFRGLVEEAGFSDCDVAKLQKLIEIKNFFAVEDMLDQLTVSKELKEIFLKMPEMLNNLAETVKFVEARSKSERVHKALDRLVKLEKILQTYGYSDYITIDLSMISTYSYYTGVIFRAYTYGNGEAVATGGRYDGLVSQFGKNAPAIGLAIVIDQLMIALSRQKLVDDSVLSGTLLLYTPGCIEKAVEKAAELRKAGEKVQLMRKSSRRDIEDYKNYIQRAKLDKIVFISENGVEEYK